MARIWIPFGLLAICVVGLTMFLKSGDSPDRVPQSGNETSDQLSEPAGSLAGTGDDPAEPQVLPAQNLERADIAHTTPLQQESFGTPVAEGGILITILDAKTEKPLPQADLLVIDTGSSDMRLLEATMATESDFEQVFLEMGTLYRTDGRAQVRIPRPIGQPFLAGRTAEHFDFVIDVEEHVEEYDLHLHRLQLLPVQVVDPKGRAVAGAPVSLRVRNGFRTTNLMSARSDENGIATLRLFDLLQREIKDDDTYVALQMLAPVPVEVAIDLQELPEQMPVLTMPDVGQVEVQLTNALGEVDRGHTTVRLELMELDAEGKEAEGIGRWDEPRKSVVQNTSTGSALFPLVAFEQMLRISAVSADGERRATLDARGPIAGGMTAVFQLTPTLVKPVLIGRLHDTDGKPAGHRQLLSTIKQASGKSNSARVHRSETDAEGNFRILVEEDYKPNALRTLNITAEADGTQPQRAVVIDISRPFGPGEHDLGQLTFEVPPVLVQGIVLDAAGEPLAHARIQLQKSFGDEENPQWRGMWELRQQSDRRGEFTARGLVEPGRFRLIVDHGEHIATRREFKLGATGLAVQLDKALTLEGRFLLDPEIDPKGLRVVLTHHEADGSKDPWPTIIDLDHNGRFSQDGLEKGKVDLVLRFEYLEEVLYRRPDFEVTAKGTSIDLGEIDLRGQLKVITLTVVDRNRVPMENVSMTSVGSYFTRPLKEQPARMVTRDGSLNLFLSADGYPRMQVDDIRSDREIVLAKGIPVRLFLDNHRQLSPGIDWIPKLSYLSGGPESDPDSRFDVDLEPVSQGVWESGVGRAGTYRLKFMIRHKESRASWALPSEPFHLQVEDRSNVQDFHYLLEQSILDIAEKRDG